MDNSASEDGPRNEPPPLSGPTVPPPFAPGPAGPAASAPPPPGAPYPQPAIPVYYIPVAAWPQPGPARPPLSALAVAGFILSLLWGAGFLAPIGLGLSIFGLREARSGEKRGEGLALAGVILGAIGSVVFIFLLIAFLTPDSA